MTKLDTGMSSVLKLKYNTGIQFGCGIGPKVVFSQAKNGLVAILNQSNANKLLSPTDLSILVKNVGSWFSEKIIKN